MLPHFGRTGKGKETKGTSLTTDLGVAFRIGVKIGLNERESMSRKTLEESSPVLALLESESELESIYIQLVSLQGTIVPRSMLNYKK